MPLVAQPQPREKNPSCCSWLPATASFLMATLLYAVTLRGVLIYDDAVIVGTDARVRNPRLWYQIWTRDYFNGGIDNLYRPLVTQSYAIQVWLQRFLPGNGPWSFHLVNILLHAIVSAQVAELGRRMVNFRVGLIAGLLFACHPIHSEAVAGIVGRAELACAACILGALLIFLKYPLTTRRAVAIFTLSVAAMLSKEQGLLMPFLLLALWPARKSLLQIKGPVPLKIRGQDPLFQSNPAPTSERKPLQLLTALLTYFEGALIVLRESILKLKFEWDRHFLDIAVQPMIKSPPVDRWLIPIMLVGRYTALLLAPFKLSIDYGLAVILPTLSRTDPYLYAGAGVILLWLILTAYFAIKKSWIPLFFLLALAMTYSMASNVIIIGTIFGERLLYIPSVFFLLLVAMLLDGIPGFIAAKPITRREVASVSLATRGVTAFVIVLILLGSFRTLTYIRHWNYRLGLYTYSLAQQPKSLKLHVLVAEVYYEQYRLKEAQQITADAEAIYPNYWELWKMSALIAERADDWDAAIYYFKKAFDVQPSVALENAMTDAIKKRDELRKKHPN
jgi:protein O-mannosyl-transferase